MNIIVGNCCGTFSGVLNYFSWMSLADIPENNFKIYLHSCNKTHDMNNVITTVQKPYITSDQFDKDLLDKNVLPKFFNLGNNISNDYPENFVFVEHYPHLYKKSIASYPEYLFKYDGKGGMIHSYIDSEHLKEIRSTFNKQWNKLSFSEEFSKRVQEEEKLIDGKKVLSIMLRTVYHYVDPRNGNVFSDNPEIFVNYAVEAVKKRMDDYDAVLVTTQNQPYIDAFKSEFGERCIYTDRPRFEDFNDWRGVGSDWYSISDDEYETEIENCLLDVILTSKTNHILGSCSNMFLGVLSMNPEVTFDLIEGISDFWGA